MDTSQINEEQIANLNILEVFGLTMLPEKQKKTFLDYMSHLALERIAVQIIKELPQEKRAECVELFKKDDSQEEKTKFFQQYVQDLPQIVAEEIFTMKQEALELVMRLKQGVKKE